MIDIELYESKHTEKYAVQLHSHPTFQVLFVIDGIGSISLNGQQTDLHKNDVVLIMPDAPHEVASDAQLTLLILSFEASSVDHYERLVQEIDLFQRSFILQLSDYTSMELKILLRKMLYLGQKNDALSKWTKHVHLQEILLLLAKSRQASQHEDANALRAERIRQYIQGNYYEPLSARDIANNMGVSIRYADDIFKENFQQTPMQYLTEVRIGVAQRLLLESDKDVAAICFEIGYESLPSFYRAFRKMVGMSPNQFRKTHQS